MGDVTELDSYRPHLSGEAECQNCQYRWGAVAPVGTIHLTCPKCLATAGVFRHGVEPGDGERFWTCSCGESLFWIKPGPVIQCRRCGERQVPT